jgi:hypothetical protein
MVQATMDSTTYATSVQQIRLLVIIFIIKVNGKSFVSWLNVIMYWPLTLSNFTLRFQHLTLEHDEERSFGTYEFR